MTKELTFLCTQTDDDLGQTFANQFCLQVLFDPTVRSDWMPKKRFGCLEGARRWRTSRQPSERSLSEYWKSLDFPNLGKF